MNGSCRKQALDGGLTLLTVPVSGVESVTTLVMVRTGSRDEPQKLAGISHFLEHMLFKGTEKYPTALALTSVIDSIGGEFNAFTSKEYTGFYIKAAVKHFPVAIEVLSEMFLKPLLEKQAVEREKGVVIEEINMYDDLPMRKVSVLFDELIFGTNSLGRETIGKKETVRKLMKSDFRKYLGSRYTGDRIVIGVVGGIGKGKTSLKSVKLRVNGGFGKIDSGSGDWWGKPVKMLQKKPKVLVFKKETGQAHFVLGVPGFARGHKDRYSLAVLSTLLGGNMSSRLFTEIREKRGLAYYIKTNISAFFDLGSFSVHAGVQIDKLGEAVKVTLEQMGMCKEKIDGKEVERAKEYLKGSLILDLEGSHEVADLYVRKFLLEKKIITPKEILKKIDEVELGDVVRVAKKLFVGEKLNLAVVGPYSKKKDGQRFNNILKI